MKAAVVHGRFDRIDRELASSGSDNQVGRAELHAIDVGPVERDAHSPSSVSRIVSPSAARSRNECSRPLTSAGSTFWLSHSLRRSQFRRDGPAQVGETLAHRVVDASRGGNLEKSAIESQRGQVDPSLVARR